MLFQQNVQGFARDAAVQQHTSSGEGLQISTDGEEAQGDVSPATETPEVLAALQTETELKAESSPGSAHEQTLPQGKSQVHPFGESICACSKYHQSLRRGCGFRGMLRQPIGWAFSLSGTTLLLQRAHGWRRRLFVFWSAPANISNNLAELVCQPSSVVQYLLEHPLKGGLLSSLKQKGRCPANDSVRKNRDVSIVYPVTRCK